jgi:hypothetical protein
MVPACRDFPDWGLTPIPHSPGNYKRLLVARENGTNLIIVGYDGYQPDDVNIEDHYLDPSRSFGHELVLYTMLKFPKAQWPWIKHKTFEF